VDILQALNAKVYTMKYGTWKASSRINLTIKFAPNMCSCAILRLCSIIISQEGYDDSYLFRQLLFQQTI
jgi:hypothetical protein